jgi:hypothetical protein
MDAHTWWLDPGVDEPRLSEGRKLSTMLDGIHSHNKECKTYVDNDGIEGDDVHGMFVIAVDDITRQGCISNLQSCTICTTSAYEKLDTSGQLTQEECNLPSDPMPLSINTQTPNQQPQTR